MKSDIIRVLPDAVANQIAAGEVIQRPASALKEILENAVDAGASDIKIWIKDAGKTLIQVSDNGCGMSAKDAELCFERHATSKIHEAKDLFEIRTLGFRGEALASIAAISQVEMKTKRKEDELGTSVIIEGSKIKDQSETSCADGTSISVKNLFFNVPARRNFLKSDSAEFRHILEEFNRVVLVNPEISFALQHNNKTLFQLIKGTLKERITAIYGPSYKEKLIPVEHRTREIQIRGFIGKPEFAKKTRGEQYFFVNKRFIKHAYLHHSVDNAFQELLPKDTHPTYFVFLELDPKNIDINIHPTKTEVNFQNNQIIYATLRSAIKQSLGKFNITPSIDFETEQSLDLKPLPKGTAIKNPFYREESDYNPFDKDKYATFSKKRNQPKPQMEQWERLYEGPLPGDNKNEDDKQHRLDELEEIQVEETGKRIIFQIKNQYILTRVKDGLMLINQENAHERILYERYIALLNNRQSLSQQELFPQNVTFAPSDAEIIKEVKDDLKILGFEINHLGRNTFIVNGTPSEIPSRDVQELLENMLESYKRNLVILNLDSNINLARSMAINMAIRKGKALKYEEMEKLIDELFACQVHDVSPSGKRIIAMITSDEIEKLFK
jgi:DNA mismatch repair protein MutL